MSRSGAQAVICGVVDKERTGSKQNKGGGGDGGGGGVLYEGYQSLAGRSVVCKQKVKRRHDSCSGML